MQKIRSFIALDVTSPAVLDKIVQVQRELLSADPSIKLVERKNIHLTIYFLGEVHPTTLKEIEKILAKIKHPPFYMKLEGIGAFPSTSNPRVIWIGVTRGADEITLLYKQIMAGLRKLGFKPDPRGFSPHVTIARVKSKDRGKIARLLMSSRPIDFGINPVDSVKLKKSTLTPKGPIYEDLFVKRLEG